MYTDLHIKCLLFLSDFLEGSVPVRLIWNPRGTKWDSFRDGLKVREERAPDMNMKDEAFLGLVVVFVQQALITAYEDICPFKHSLKWTFELESLFNKCLIDKNPQSWGL